MVNFWLIFGGIFFLVGLVITVVFASVNAMSGGLFGGFIIMPVVFMLAGLGVLIYAFTQMKKKRDILKSGTRYSAKIYGYVENTSYTVNDQYPVNIKVRYFDKRRVEREAILETNFPKGSEQTYAIGMTIDIYELNGQYNFDKNSVRSERIWGEEELMDDKPIAPEEQTMVAVNCPNCGASFSAVQGYANKCPYCGSYLNV